MKTDRFGPIDFDRFHRHELPILLEARGPVFTAADFRAGPAPGLPAPRRTAPTPTSPSDGSFTVEAGSDRADTVVELDHDEWCAFVWELRSCFAMFYADRITIPRGSFGQLARWEPSLRVAFDGQDVYDLDDPPPVVDEDGRPLDLARAFTLDDDHGEIADFLDRAGFVHLRGVMDDDEVAALRTDVDQAVDAASPTTGGRGGRRSTARRCATGSTT